MQCPNMNATCRLLFLFFVAWTFAAALSADEDLIGWKGDTFDPQEVFGGADEGPVKLSESPRAYIWKNFISKQEARHIAELAAPHLKRSKVGTNHSSIQGRTSYGAFILRYQDEVIAAVEERAAEWVGVPIEHQEGIQVLRYSEGQTYRQHMDGMGRMATMLIYLTDTPDGGETAFPNTTDSNWLDPSLKPAGLSACAEGHVAVKPEIGTALLFFSLPPTAHLDKSLRKQVDPASLHTGCPPGGDGHGLKWTATIWTHVEPYGSAVNKTLPKPTPPDPAVCRDLHPHCKNWAVGECGKNYAYMMGEDNAGHCRRACGACVQCKPGAEACWTAEREKLGLLGHLDEELTTLFGDKGVTASEPAPADVHA